MSRLNGITRLSSFKPPQNPAPHSPIGFRNEVLLEKHSPDGKVQRVHNVGNIMCTYGLDRLAALLASSSGNYNDTDGASTAWIAVGAVGTSSTAAASTDTTLGGSTESVHRSAASMNISDLGSMTVEAQMTFDGTNAYTIREVGVFASNDAGGGCLAHNVLNATDYVTKGASDTVNVSHRISLTTTA